MTARGAVSLVLALLAVALGACGSSGSTVTRTETTTLRTGTNESGAERTARPTTTTAHKPADPKCTPVDLGIHYALGQGAAGSFIERFEFINVSRHECHMVGAPGLAAYGRRGQRLPLEVRRIAARTGHGRVRLAPRGRAAFDLQTSRHTRPCETAVRLRFTPPNDYSTLAIRHRERICGAGYPASVSRLYRPR